MKKHFLYLFLSCLFLNVPYNEQQSGVMFCHFVVRCREHLGINKKGISIKSASSSIRDHINETGHAASFDDFCILDKANNNFDLLIHESLLILRDRPTLNQQNSSIPLYLF